MPLKDDDFALKWSLFYNSRYFDFSLHFQVSLPPFSSAVFLVNPRIDGSCGGGDMAEQRDGHDKEASTHYAPHHQCMSNDQNRGTAVDLTAARVPPPPCDITFHTCKYWREYWIFSLVVTWILQVLREAAGWSDHTPPLIKPLAPPPPPSPPLPPVVTIENQCLKVWIDTKYGMQAVFDKTSGRNHSLHHELIHYGSAINDAYHAEMTGVTTQAIPVAA